MTMTQRNTRHILASEESLREWFRRNAQTQAMRDARQRAEAGLHPTPEMLCDYIAGAMNTADSRIISDHLLFCGLCAQEELRIHALRGAIEQELDDIEEEWFGADEPIPVTRLADDIAVEIGWELMRQAAAGMQEEHTFTVKDGRIKTICEWESPKNDCVGFVMIKWDAEIESDRELIIQFFQPKTHEIFYEEEIGTIRHSHTTFTFDELGFDPEHEPWAIAIV